MSRNSFWKLLSILPFACLGLAADTSFAADSFTQVVVFYSQNWGPITLHICHPQDDDKYTGEIFIEDNKTPTIKLLYDGSNCRSEIVSSDLQWIFISDGVRGSGDLAIFKHQTELDYIQVEKDLSSRADQFERANGLIPQGAKYKEGGLIT